MRTLTMAIAASTLAVPVALTVGAAPAEAQSRYYDRQGNYNGPTWRGRNGRYQCRKPNGQVGLLVGGGVGAVIGNQVAGRGDRLLGTVIGGAVGAVVGREIDREESGRRDNRGRRCR
jgi:outer membrane lipoprotein SlyB